MIKHLFITCFLLIITFLSQAQDLKKDIKDEYKSIRFFTINPVHIAFKDFGVYYEHGLDKNYALRFNLGLILPASFLKSTLLEPLPKMTHKGFMLGIGMRNYTKPKKRLFIEFFLQYKYQFCNECLEGSVYDKNNNEYIHLIYDQRLHIIKPQVIFGKQYWSNKFCIEFYTGFGLNIYYADTPLSDNSKPENTSYRYSGFGLYEDGLHFLPTLYLGLKLGLGFIKPKK